jgi:phosphate butyryltransferase
MHSSFDDMIRAASELPVKKTVCIANAADKKILLLVREILENDLAKVILVTEEKKTRAMAEAEGIDLAGVEIIDETNPAEIPLKAVQIVSSHQADVFVKGHLNSSDFLKAVLDKEAGLRTGAKLSVMTCYDVPVLDKLFFLTDGGMVVAPTLEDKKAMLIHAVTVLNNMGIEEPKVAILSSNEKVSPKIPSTVDAEALCNMAEAGELPPGIYEGPIAFDVAMRPEVAAEKGITSRVSGDVDLFLVPSVETGNCLGKAIGFFGGGDTAGIVIGASRPVVMSSRGASLKGKLTAVAWALLAGK